MKQLEQNIIQWAKDRGIYEHSDSKAQALKAVSELGEVADAVIKGRRDDLIDGIGDTIVCLVNLAYMNGTDLTECVGQAWLEIKDRKGAMSPSGAWVKDA